jgi:F420 biosynthesis protein FbiB-like protein
VPEEKIAYDVGRSQRQITQSAAAVVLCLTMADMDVYLDPQRQLAERQMSVQSVALAGQNLLLMASASGLGACWMCAPLFCPDVVREVLQLAADWEPQALITLGYPAEAPQKTRAPLETRVLWR